jgi:hypothetical protein
MYIISYEGEMRCYNNHKNLNKWLELYIRYSDCHEYRHIKFPFKLYNFWNTSMAYGSETFMIKK